MGAVSAPPSAPPSPPPSRRGVTTARLDLVGNRSQGDALLRQDVTTAAPAPPDPVGDAVADALRDVLFGATVSVTYVPEGSKASTPVRDDGSARAVGPGPPGWDSTITIQLGARVARLLQDGPSALGELLGVLPAAGLRTAAHFRSAAGDGPVPAATRRAVRDTLAAEILAAYFEDRLGTPPPADLIPEIVDYLIELSGTRVEAHDLTHGVVVTDVLQDTPRLVVRYPDDLRPAKRAPLLFDGQRSVLVVDPHGNARTELQRHRIERLGDGPSHAEPSDSWSDSGSLVSKVTRAVGGIGFFVRADRSIWTFVGGQPLLVRRGEHWTAFPVELGASIANMIGGGPAAEIVARAAFLISGRPQGAILAVVADAGVLEGSVSVKDRFDLRSDIDPTAMRPETRLHHLLDAEQIDEQTLTRLASLDGATVVDRAGRLLAYGAIVTTSDSEHEGARTSAARTLSHTALVVLKVSADGDITIFRDGDAVTTLLGHPGRTLPER